MTMHTTVKRNSWIAFCLTYIAFRLPDRALGSYILKQSARCLILLTGAWKLPWAKILTSSSRFLERWLVISGKRRILTAMFLRPESPSGNASPDDSKPKQAPTQSTPVKIWSSQLNWRACPVLLRLPCNAFFSISILQEQCPVLLRISSNASSSINYLAGTVWLIAALHELRGKLPLTIDRYSYQTRQAKPDPYKACVLGLIQKTLACVWRPLINRLTSF